MTSSNGLRSLRATSFIGALGHCRPRLEPGISSRVQSPLRTSQRMQRSFHIQPAISAAIEGTQEILLNIHAVTNTPWCLTIPLFAVGVSVFFRLPCTIYAHDILQRRSKHAVIIQACNARIQRDVQREGIFPTKRLREVKARQEKVIRRLYAKLGLQEWKLYGSLLSLPFWLTAIDAVRRLCGGPRGLLASLVAGPRDAGAGGSGTAESAGAPGPLATTTSGAASDIPGIDSTATSGMVETLTQAAEPSMAVEGCLWFPDLTIADPYHILPFALSITLVAHVIPKSGDGIRALFGPKTTTDQSAPSALTDDDKLAIGEKTRSFFHRVLLVAAIAVGPATLNLPAAVHLYWLSSSATNWISGKILKHFKPASSVLQVRCTGTELPVIRPQRRPEDALSGKGDKVER
ncbi:Uu.00g077540.m01.CDS01 [Anthostomella pinea]|uniref:Uu.00g077540.m01.CDS01 n=1 Tax=Anthostomella pinea TaxID=933095 RepID=A0AAI8VW24_9PEZI|nr:Uu.00g077540.m01.CDS01 [Anthostomella pinea]